jgi:hypothetical protein
LWHANDLCRVDVIVASRPTVAGRAVGALAAAIRVLRPSKQALKDSRPVDVPVRERSLNLAQARDRGYCADYPPRYIDLQISNNGPLFQMTRTERVLCEFPTKDIGPK